jgi:hypothetical protein
LATPFPGRLVVRGQSIRGCFRRDCAAIEFSVHPFDVFNAHFDGDAPADHIQPEHDAAGILPAIQNTLQASHCAACNADFVAHIQAAVRFDSAGKNCVSEAGDIEVRDRRLDHRYQRLDGERGRNRTFNLLESSAASVQCYSPCSTPSVLLGASSFLSLAGLPPPLGRRTPNSAATV